MAPPQFYATCPDCVKVLQDAASLLSSDAKKPRDFLLNLFHKSHRTRLIANLSASKCRMCLLLSTSIPRLLQPLDDEELLVLEVSRARHDLDAAVVGLVGFSEGASGMQRHYSGGLRIQDVKHGHISVLKSSTTWSEESSNRIRVWLEMCLGSHATCSQPQTTKDSLPRRLIDVSAFHPPGQFKQIKESRRDDFESLSLENLGHVRIVSSASLPENSQYITLSHRWGNPPSIVLSKKTTFLLAEDITPYLLDCEEASVFRHAIHVARTLGFRYIWIDALCIMQDDGAEKTEDIMQMDDIYAKATLNISAAEGNILEGLVLNRDTLLLNPHRVTVGVPNRSEDMHLQVFENQCTLRSRECPLAHRGWVFQERMLSPRIVHFTKKQLFWKCRCLSGSEVLPLGVLGPDLARPGYCS